MALFWLSDESWAAIEPHLPRNQPGARRVDDRRIISGIVHVLETGCRWRDCPAEYGPFTTVYNRFARWSRRSFWPKILAALADTRDRDAERRTPFGKAGRVRPRPIRRTGATVDHP